MRLNLDCIRALLLCVEEHSAPNKNPIQFVNLNLSQKVSEMIGTYEKPSPQQEKLLETFTNDDIIYSLDYCLEAGLLHSFNASGRGQQIYHIVDLTVKGHDFLGNIRYKNIYEKVKAVTEELGAQSLPAITQIASSVMSEIIKAHILQ